MATPWEKLVRRKRDATFLRLYAQGVKLVRCYCEAHGCELGDDTDIEARSFLIQMRRKYPQVLDAIKQERGEMMDVLTDDGILSLLGETDPAHVAEGIKHARARRGLDAPTKLQLSNPEVSRGEVKAADPKVPLVERLAKLLGNG